ncbi:DUF6476 family protein [Halocynthiibacter sp. C4]|uniref:DUF6476 family protein n=1 Tax=Halocynthiibacter sp. C4 TaxID=2992758 RepID=UPI00237BBB70|nr:DUF6476 family protein [Halocynthiibacter sp. C4]MDE0589048.1 DUF6476 family protein [Halocynthiibacter sp. C4]
MDHSPETEPELPPNLKFLRILVTILTATMIAGLVIVIALLVTRFPKSTGPSLSSISEIELPAGTKATAFTKGSDWYAVVTEQDQILIFDTESGDLRQTIQITAK